VVLAHFLTAFLADLKRYTAVGPRRVDRAPVILAEQLAWMVCSTSEPVLFLPVGVVFDLAAAIEQRDDRQEPWFAHNVNVVDLDDHGLAA